MPIKQKGPALTPRKTRPKVATQGWMRNLYRVTEGMLEDQPLWAGDRSKLLGAIRARDWDLVLQCTKSSPAQMYQDAAHYFAAAQVENLFKKLPIPGNDTRCREAAWDTFQADEWRNRRTNQRFQALMRRGYSHRRNPMYTRLLSRMQRTIADILGESPNLERVYGFCDFGPGACTNVGGDSTHVFAKLDSCAVGRRALPYLLGSIWSHDQKRQLFTQSGILRELPRESFRKEVLSWVEWCEYNKIDFVVKNATTHRLIASEPSGNQWLQLGLGELMSVSLTQARPFIDLTNQQRNQLLAYEASCVDAPRPQATIDLKSSSQSLARMMVRAVFALAPGWFSVMDDLRSGSYKCDMGSGNYELFVSMGNGFCFPLQSIIYSAAIEAVYQECGRKPYYAVFGDDLIVDQDIALLLIEWLKFLGVRTNVDKTFIFGPFRESCGSDFFNGTPVRPFVLDWLPETGRDLVKAANGFRTVAPTWQQHTWWAIWEIMPKEARSTVVPWKVPMDKGLMVWPEFYEIHRLDKFDQGLQRHLVRQYATSPVRDESWYGSLQHASGQMFGLLRGITPKVQKRYVEGRETPMLSSGGVPVPSLRRKVKQRMVDV